MADIASFIALGDSFTEGLHDELGPDGRHLGWSDRVAAALALRDGSQRYANLAVRGRLLDEVVAEQVPFALDHAPDLISFHAGPNDVLRPRVQLASLMRRYDAAVAALRADGAEVVLFTALERAGGSGRLADSLARRFCAFNAAVRRTSERHGARVVDVGPVTALHDRRMWNEDRLHLAPRGHERVAAAMLEALDLDDPDLLGGPPGWWRAPLSSERPSGLGAVKDDVAWVGRYLVPWVGRRLRGVSSGDGMEPKRPDLVELEGEAGAG